MLGLGTGCLACEFACTFHGNKAITIDVPVAGAAGICRQARP
ncbi:MAG: hypothetical protein V8Q91_16970 [Bilophila wadsworthia]